jgi:hypothetical protein
MKTKEEIREVTDKFDDYANDFPGMTYEQGVKEALEWVLGDIEDSEFSPYIFTH